MADETRKFIDSTQASIRDDGASVQTAHGTSASIAASNLSLAETLWPDDSGQFTLSNREK